MSKAEITSSLSNKTILVTRPSGRENHLRQLIEKAGGSIIHYPAFAIQPPAQLEIVQLKLLREHLHSFTMAIFISPTAVEQSHIYFPVLPEHMTIVSIGSKTSKALAQQNIQVDFVASEHNSESLLQAEKFQMPQLQGQRILIFRGNGGRALLGDTLAGRGAQIRYVETYKRELPAHPSLTTQQIKSLDALTVSSNEGLDNLITLMDDPGLLIDIPLVLPSERAAKLAKHHGFKTIISAQNATDEATLAALTDHFTP